MASKVIFASSFWRIYLMTESVVLCHYQFNGEHHDLCSQEFVENLHEALRRIDSTNVQYPVIMTSNGKNYADSLSSNCSLTV
ncbi:Uncharacterised protein [Neisseria weaveri]|nr:Uncharacterised protein [Neisseria weaveri]